MGVLAASVTLASCYGKATPESCHAKYVRDKRGDAVRDTYERCLERASTDADRNSIDLADLKRRVAFETGCSTPTVTPLEFDGKLVTLVGANACGRRLAYRRALRRRFGGKTTRNAPWQLVGDSAAVVDSSPVLQVNVSQQSVQTTATQVAPTAPTVAPSGNAPQPRTVSDNPYQL